MHIEHAPGSQSHNMTWWICSGNLVPGRKPPARFFVSGQARVILRYNLPPERQRPLQRVRCRRAVDAARALCHCGAQTVARQARGDHAVSGEQLAFGHAPPQRARMARLHFFAHHFRTLLHTLHIVSSSRSACRLCRSATTAPPASVRWHVRDACEWSAAVVPCYMAPTLLLAGLHASFFSRGFKGHCSCPPISSTG